MVVFKPGGVGVNAGRGAEQTRFHLFHLIKHRLWCVEVCLREEDGPLRRDGCLARMFVQPVSQDSVL